MLENGELKPRGIKGIRGAYEIQSEINKLTKLQAKFKESVTDERKSAMASEISTIIVILSWVGMCDGIPAPSKHIENFLNEHPEYRASILYT